MNANSSLDVTAESENSSIRPKRGKKMIVRGKPGCIGQPSRWFGKSPDFADSEGHSALIPDRIKNGFFQVVQPFTGPPTETPDAQSVTLGTCFGRREPAFLRQEISGPALLPPIPRSIILTFFLETGIVPGSTPLQNRRRLPS
jgi:hypothetical protein